ncbi:MAG: VWA domain-containing protein [Proteobacteria bacterium]|nr:VWA domain-containing protein [Pseudomonadota bacterium]
MAAFELILDSSGSMDVEITGGRKIEIAQRVMNELLDALPDGNLVGLRLYGHLDLPGSSACDTQLVASIEPLTATKRQELHDWINKSRPRGNTPMVRSLLEATGDFPPRWTGPKTVILVTDGVETCTGSIKAVAEARATKL